MKVPFYENRNPDYTYENNDYKWVDLDIFLKAINKKTISDFGSLSAFHLNEIDEKQYKEKLETYPPISIDGDNFVEFGKFIIASKVLYSTGFLCEYGLWIQGTGNHHGIDLILPKNTPIVSFSDGEVVKIKNWDGVKKDEGNCIVIKSNIDGETLYLCYEHLEKIDVKVGDKVKNGQQIGTCGNTGNSTTNHLHFQIDNDKAPFHPFWSHNIQDTIKYCIDGWEFLQKNYKKVEEDNDIINEVVSELKNENNTSTNNEEKEEDKNDLVTELISSLDNKDKNSENYIDFFKNINILKGDNGNYYLESNLTRYQFTLIMYRLSKKGFLKIKQNNCDFNFQDTKNINEQEFKNALKLVVCSQIMKGEGNHFYPWKKLSGEQFLAIMGRLFANIKDNKNGIWYENYLSWAENKNLINKNWDFINKPITRDEVLKILYKLLFLDDLS